MKCRTVNEIATAIVHGATEEEIKVAIPVGAVAKLSEDLDKIAHWKASMDEYMLKLARDIARDMATQIDQEITGDEEEEEEESDANASLPPPASVWSPWHAASCPPGVAAKPPPKITITLKGQVLPAWQTPIIFDAEPVSRCECGSAKLGYDPGPAHSHWCPEWSLYKKGVR